MRMQKSAKPLRPTCLPTTQIRLALSPLCDDYTDSNIDLLVTKFANIKERSLGPGSDPGVRLVRAVKFDCMRKVQPIVYNVPKHVTGYFASLEKKQQTFSSEEQRCRAAEIPIECTHQFTDWTKKEIVRLCGKDVNMDADM